VQKKLIPLFHYSLNPGGILFLGSAETIGGFTDLFRPAQRQIAALPADGSAAARPEPVEFPSSFSRPAGAEAAEPRHAEAAGQPPVPGGSTGPAALRPPAVLVNDKGDILYISGRTGKYLEPAAGKANWNIFAMAREGLRYELASAFQKALRKRSA
jgi:two-component system, chemotaxis family, CheB/CheR fusion protein